MTSRLLSFSLCLNLLLMGLTTYFVSTKHPSGNIKPPAEIPETNRVTENLSRPIAPLRWSDLESQDYPIYVANLRKAGCPEPVLRQIISADLKELYARKAFALVKDFHRDFWEIAARENVRQYFDRTLALQLKALSAEPDALLQQLVGTAPVEPTRTAPDDLQQSTADKEVQALYGVDFTETEQRDIAKALDDYHRRMDSQVEVESETLDQKVQTVLGPARFADFNRSRSATYRELYELLSDFGQPTESAAAIFDLRLESEKQSDEIRADRNRSPEEKQVALDDLQERVEQGIRSKVGEAAFQTYQSGSGRWINALGRL